MSILIVSNGFGEDLIGERIGQSLKKYTLEITAAPLVGKGTAYSFKTISSSKMLPSGGFLRSFRDVIKDIAFGLLKNFWLHYKNLKKLRGNFNKVIIVGDVFCLLFSYLIFKQKCYFLPTAKSHSFSKHTFIEKWIMKKLCIKIYPRDELTSNDLLPELSSKFLGNPMMDSFPHSNKKYSIKPELPVIGFLPGSRSEWIQNLESMMKLSLAINKSNASIQFMVSLHPDSSLSQINLGQNTDWQYQESIGLINRQLTIFETDCFGDFLRWTWLCIGLAGTANEQAHQHNIPIVCFPGFGPQSSSLRFKEQKKLLGNKNFFFFETNSIDTLCSEALKVLPSKKNSYALQKSAADLIAEDIILNSR